MHSGSGGGSFVSKLGFLSALTIAALISGSALLASCQPGQPISNRAAQPLSPQMLSLLERKGMDKEDPILIRIFKEESELEVWKQDPNGQMALLKTYPICRWSGELGPKCVKVIGKLPKGPTQLLPHK